VSERTAWCPRCKRETEQQYWSHRGGWICVDGTKGCGQRVVSQEEYEETQARVAAVTAADIWGK